MLMRWPSLLELQAFLVEMVNNFEFELTEKATRIRREACLVMVPTVEGEVDKGAQLPMRVRVASREWTMMTPFLFFSFLFMMYPNPSFRVVLTTVQFQICPCITAYNTLWQLFRKSVLIISSVRHPKILQIDWLSSRGKSNAKTRLVSEFNWETFQTIRCRGYQFQRRLI